MCIFISLYIYIYIYTHIFFGNMGQHSMVPPPSTHGNAHNQGVKPSIGCLDAFREFPSNTPTKNKRFSSYSTNISEAKLQTNVSNFVIDEFFLLSTC